METICDNNILFARLSVVFIGNSSVQNHGVIESRGDDNSFHIDSSAVEYISSKSGGGGGGGGVGVLVLVGVGVGGGVAVVVVMVVVVVVVVVVAIAAAVPRHTTVVFAAV